MSSFELANEQTILFETERLRLRKLTLDDADFMLRLLNEPSFIKNIGDRQVRTLDQARSYLVNYPFVSYEEHGYGPFVAEEKQNGRPVGICGFRKRDSLPYPDLGYALLPEFCHRGFAWEASEAMMNFGRQHFGMVRIFGLVNTDNAPSIRLLEKLGFTFHKNMVMEGEGTEVYLYISEPG